MPLADLAARGALPGRSADLLAAVVARRLAFLVTGGTGSGKTTLLSALLGTVPPGERLVLCEDAPELAPAHPHVVRLVTRPPNVEAVGEVTLRDLVRQALRMRPDRLVVGEVRGAEVTDLLAALNTGHDGGCGTLHANRPAEVPARLEALGVAAGLDRLAVHSQAAAALSLVVHLRRTASGRRVEEIGVVRRAGDLVVVEPAWRADGGPCPGADRLADLLGPEGHVLR
jgi:pilus assembly protein CpaF